MFACQYIECTDVIINTITSYILNNVVITTDWILSTLPHMWLELVFELLDWNFFVSFPVNATLSIRMLSLAYISTVNILHCLHPCQCFHSCSSNIINATRSKSTNCCTFICWNEMTVQTVNVTIVKMITNDLHVICQLHCQLYISIGTDMLRFDKLFAIHIEMQYS